MPRVLLFALTIMLVLSQWGQWPIAYAQANAQNLPTITNSTSLTVQTVAESLSDLEYFVTAPDGTVSYAMTTNTGAGVRTQTLALGTARDEATAGCVRNDNGRRLGICQDGIYKFKIVSTDAAGNASEPKLHAIERDTVRPTLDSLGELKLCGNDICIDIAGEPDTDIMLNGSFLQKLTANGQIVVKRGWQYDTKYRYVFHLRDAAGNVSDTHSRELHTEVLAVGDADPYLGKDTTTFKPVVMDVNIEYGGEYKITNYVVPFPQLTFAETSIQKLVSIYGVALSKGHALEVRVRTKFMTYDQARAACSAPDSIAFMSAEERECMQRHMGINSIWDWHWQVVKECGYAIPVYTVFCIENKKSTKFVSQYKDNLAEKVDHVLIVLHNQSGQEVGRLWNDDASGRFRFDRALGEGLNVGDQIKAKVVIFGDFEYDGVKVDYRGVDPKSAARNEGLSSVYSNEVVVPEPKDFINSVVSPVGDPSCDGVDITSPYGTRTDPITKEKKFHDGVDLAKPSGCKITAVYSGHRINTDGYGTTVKIVHDDFAFTTIYGHAAYTVGSNGHVDTGQNIMYMGRSGRATGVHLHFVVRQGCTSYNCRIDPVIHFREHLNDLPSFYKHYE